MSYRLEIGTALLLAVAIAIGIWAANRKERTPDLDFRTSTYLNGPRGSKALHDVLTRLGRPSERRRTPLYTLATERAHRPAILVLLNPVIDLQDAELEQVTRYIRDGGAVGVRQRPGRDRRREVPGRRPRRPRPAAQDSKVAAAR